MVWGGECNRLQNRGKQCFFKNRGTVRTRANAPPGMGAGTFFQLGGEAKVVTAGGSNMAPAYHSIC